VDGWVGLWVGKGGDREGEGDDGLGEHFC
jgi:hypothetical protein